MAEAELPPEQTTDGSPIEEAPEKKSYLTVLKEWPLSRKIALAAATLISIALFAVLIIQARTADYQLLYANLAEGDAASVVQWLKGQKIPYQLKNKGKNIWISADKLYETRLDLAASGLPSGGGMGFEVFDKQSFALTDFVQKVNYTRALQGELARTITSLDPVESTRVHLAIPEKRLFKQQQKQATASVIVSLIPGRALDEEQVKGVIHLVSGSVTGLDPKNVTVIDSNGVLLEDAIKKDDEKLLSVDMLAFQQEVEHRLEIRAQDLLDKTMGKDKAMVRVTATLDFAKVEKSEELFDAEEPVIRSEQINQEASGSQTAGGVPGVQSNLQGNTTTPATAGPSSNKSSRITNYEISKTVSKIVNPVGSIQKLSVSVLVADKVVPADDTNPEQVVPRTPEELQALESMVAAALGLVVERGDVINITSMPFTAPSPEELLATSMPGNMVYEYLPFIKYGLIALAAFMLYLLIVRPIIKTMKGDVQEHYKTVEELERMTSADQGQAQEELEDMYEDPVVTLRKEVMRNQVPTAFIIKNWLQEG